MTVSAVAVIISTPVITKLTRKIRSLSTVMLGALFYCIGFGSIYFVDSFIALSVSTFIWTIGEILISTNINVFVAENSPIERVGRYNSFLLFIGALGTAIGPIISGKLVGITGIRGLWPIVGLIAILYLLLVMVINFWDLAVQKRL